MSRRNTSASARRSRGGADAANGGGRNVSSALQTAGLEMDHLRAELLSSLTSVVTDTVDMVCEQHEESFMQAAQAVHQLNGGGRGTASSGGEGRGYGRSKPSRAHLSNDTEDPALSNDYDLFHRCCQRLVTYIDANLSTSPDFKQQMDRVILACHSNASEVVLGSVVTRKLWFHTKNLNGTDDDGDQEEEEEDEDKEVVEARGQFLRGRPTASRRLPAPPLSSRGVKRRVSAPPPPPPRRTAKGKPPVTKRARRESANRKVNYAPRDEETEDEQREQESTRKRKRRAARIHYSDEDGAEQHDDEHDDVVFVTNDAAKQPHYGQADELLSFKDAIGDMCYADRRTPAQTRFFKERLRKAIQFVDAQLCKPPKGKSCTWDCAKIRRQMCNRDLPCRNKICRLWHDVEAHTDRCQNLHCEFRIRVMLRETMYKIDHKKLELQGFRNELHTKKKELLDLKSESVSDRDNFVERRLLGNETDQLESEIENAEKDLGMFKATKKTYWATLNEIGLTVEDDVNDQFPPFNEHYVDKKSAAKKKTPTMVLKHSEDTTTSSRSDRSRRRQSFDTVSAAASPVQKRERITRRSTQQSLKVLTDGVIELDDDEDDNANEEEETKTDRSAEYDDDSAARQPTRDEANRPETNGTGSVSREQESKGDEEETGGRVDTITEQPSAEADEEDGETEARSKDTPPQSTADAGSTKEQAADYVIDSEGAQSKATPAAVVSMTSALEAFNQVVDAHLEPSDGVQADGKASEGDQNTHAKDTAEEDNAPLLPF